MCPASYVRSDSEEEEDRKERIQELYTSPQQSFVSQLERKDDTEDTIKAACRIESVIKVSFLLQVDMMSF